jgi:hypothetical protein
MEKGAKNGFLKCVFCIFLVSHDPINCAEGRLRVSVAEFNEGEIFSILCRCDERLISCLMKEPFCA